MYSVSRFGKSNLISRLTQVRALRNNLCTSSVKASETVEIVLVKKPEMKEYRIKGKVGENMLDIMVANKIEFPGFGACEGTLACSTCHVYFDEKDYKRIEEQPTDEELDMLDLAYSPTSTSRLCCQVD